jgi:uncharacterized protein YdeI (BOF family)
MRASRAAVPGLAFLVFSVVGCSGIRTINISSEPTAAFIQVDGQNVGVTPLAQTLDFANHRSHLISASLTGYFTEEVAISGYHYAVKTGDLRLVLKEDEAWKATTVSEATNNWVRIQVDPKLTSELVWQKLVDSVTSAYSSLEQMDNSSGYLRSLATSRTFAGPKGKFTVRTRFTGSIAQKEPLVYKLKIEADISWNGAEWTPYARVFKTDAALIEEIQSRLGDK